MILLRSRLFVRVFWVVVLVLALLPCPVYASTQEAETLPLTISEVSASNIGYYSATISWKTNGDATSQVFYDTESHDSVATYAYHTDEDTDLVTEHSIPLTGLSAGTTYHYRVRSAIPDTDSEDYTFGTLTPVVGGGGGGGPWVAPPPAPPAGTTDVRGMVSAAGVFLNSVPAISEDELCTLTIPEGTVGLTEELEPLDEIAMLIMDEPPAPPEDAHVIGLAYAFEPSGATFDPAITLEYTYDPADIPEGVAEGDLVIAYYDEVAGEWVELEGCVVDTENNTITASVEHFTTFAIIGTPPAPAAFSVSNLSIQPAEVEPNETVTIIVSVANTGGTEGSYSVVLKINGVKEEEQSVTVAAGSSEDVSFSVTREDAASYNVVVDGLSGSFVIAAPAPLAKPVNWPLIGGIIAGVIVVGLGIFFLVRRRAY